MSATGRFRTALGGFNRQDVADYIERSAQAHNAQLQQLKEEAACLQKERDTALAELAQVKVQLDAALEGNPIVPEGDPAALELEAYRRAEAAERSANARIRRQTEKLEKLMDALAQEQSGASRELTELVSAMELSIARSGEIFAALQASLSRSAEEMDAIRKENME